MVQEMRNMEKRLKGSRKSELDELEVKLSNTMKELLDKSVEEALKKLQSKHQSRNYKTSYNSTALFRTNSIESRKRQT